MVQNLVSFSGVRYLNFGAVYLILAPFKLWCQRLEMVSFHRQNGEGGGCLGTCWWFDLCEKDFLPTPCFLYIYLNVFIYVSLSLFLSHTVHVYILGGAVLFRDYGIHDMAEIRMAEQKGHKISDNFYVRKDGTRAYYFSERVLAQMFEEAGFVAQELKMHRYT